MEREQTKHFSITLPMGATDFLDRVAKRRGANRAFIVREAVLDWISRQPPEPVTEYDPGDDEDTTEGGGG